MDKSSRTPKTSWVSASATIPNGRGLIIATILSLLSIGGAFAGGAIWVSSADSAVEDKGQVYCDRAMAEHQEREKQIYARESDLTAMQAKIDALDLRVKSMHESLKEFRVETRNALSRGRRR